MSAWENLGHTVHPLIMGGNELEQADQSGSAAAPPSWKQRIKPFVPRYLWETARDFQLLRFDKYAGQELKAKIEELQPDLVYERANYLQTSGVTIAEEMGVPHILEINSPYVEERQTLSGGSFFLREAEKAEKEQLLRTQQAVVVSTALQHYFEEKWEVPEEKFIITPNAIDPDKIAIDSSRVEALRDALGLGGKLVFGFVGSIFRWHGVDLLIRAFARLNAPNTHLLIVGDGEIRPELEAMATSLVPESNVTFTGSVEHREVFNYLDLMDITVLPNSHWYGSPIKLFEYGAMGKAIIAPDNVPVKDVLIPGDDGLLVKPTVDSLFPAMKHLVESPDQRVRMAEGFQEKVLTRHTWSAMAQKILHDAAITA